MTVKKENLIAVTGIVCQKCKEFIYSRSRHDFRYCKCGAVAIDGGRDYLRIIGERSDWETELREVVEGEGDDDYVKRLTGKKKD